MYSSEYLIQLRYEFTKLFGKIMPIPMIAMSILQVYVTTADRFSVAAACFVFIVVQIFIDSIYAILAKRGSLNDGWFNLRFFTLIGGTGIVIYLAGVSQYSWLYFCPIGTVLPFSQKKPNLLPGLLLVAVSLGAYYLAGNSPEALVVPLCSGIAVVVMATFSIRYIYLTRLNLMEQTQSQLLTTERLERSLAEKNTLLAEIHHRVKNNLQVISAMVSLQNQPDLNDIARLQLDSLGRRIKTMGLLHSLLYNSQDFSQISIHDYLKSIVDLNFKGQPKNYGDTAAAFDIADISLNLETALPVGLIVNEIVSNALKHAFPVTENPQINMKLSSVNGTYVLQIGDNGPGKPADPQSGRKKLGLRLIEALAQQIHAKIVMAPQGSFLYELTFVEQKKESERWQSGQI